MTYIHPSPLADELCKRMLDHGLEQDNFSNFDAAWVLTNLLVRCAYHAATPDAREAFLRPIFENALAMTRSKDIDEFHRWQNRKVGN